VNHRCPIQHLREIQNDIKRHSKCESADAVNSEWNEVREKGKKWAKRQTGALQWL
jgi:hypothetical protein